MVCSNFPPEPVVAASLAYDLANSLAGHYPVMVLTPRPSRPHGFLFDKERVIKQKFSQTILKSYTCSRLSLIGRMRESYSFGKHVSRYIREKGYGEIELAYVCAWPLFAQYQIIRTLRKLGILSVIHIEDIYPESLSNKFPLFGKFLTRILLPLDIRILNASSKVIAVSENMRNTLIRTRGIDAAKISLIRNWQDEREFVRYRASQCGKHENESVFTLMYLGNIGPVAGVDFLIRSFAQAALKEARLVIAGSGSMKDACREIASFFPDAQIFFKDVPQGKVPEVQAQADVLLLPVKKGSAMSSVPSKLSAYLFSAKPVIACVDDCSDTAAAIREASCGWIVPPENQEELKRLLHFVAGLSKSELQQMGMNGYRYAKMNFSKEKNLKKMIALINDVLNSRSKS